MYEYVLEKGKLAKEAAKVMKLLNTEVKNGALYAMAEALIANKEFILEENGKDIKAGEAVHLQNAMLDRLRLNEKRIYEMAEGIKNVASLPDPIGKGIGVWTRPNGLQISQIRVPIGVIGMIYEARPNVTADAAALCIKAGNAVILRGGKEAIYSNSAIIKVLKEAVEAARLPKEAIQFIDNPDREAVNYMMKLNGYIDVLIPRGGAGLIQNVVQNATVPVIETGVGNCHIYVDAVADLEMAEDIIINAKTQRPAVCNAAETLLVHENIALELLPIIQERFIQLGVEIRGCERTQKILKNIKKATEEDWKTEYLDLIMAIRIVKSFDEAIEHISDYGSGHSEAIITELYGNAQRFLREIDAAAVYVNASTRFTDGSEFGFGAEIGISTQKLHARGPMGLEALTTVKYQVYGTGQIRQ